MRLPGTGSREIEGGCCLPPGGRPLGVAEGHHPLPARRLICLVIDRSAWALAGGLRGS